MSLFSHSEINTGRQAAVDMAKFFAIVFMVIIHTIEGGDGNVDSGAAVSCCVPLTGVTRISADITRIYIVSWVIIMWLLYVPVTNYLEIQLGIWPLVGIGIIILVLSVLLARVKPINALKI